jgi:hypothetical protein
MEHMTVSDTADAIGGLMANEAAAQNEAATRAAEEEAAAAVPKLGGAAEEAERGARGGRNMQRRSDAESVTTDKVVGVGDHEIVARGPSSHKQFHDGQ